MHCGEARQELEAVTRARDSRPLYEPDHRFLLCEDGGDRPVDIGIGATTPVTGGGRCADTERRVPAKDVRIYRNLQQLR